MDLTASSAVNLPIISASLRLVVVCTGVRSIRWTYSVARAPARFIFTTNLVIFMVASILRFNPILRLVVARSASVILDSTVPSPNALCVLRYKRSPRPGQRCIATIAPPSRQLQPIMTECNRAEPFCWAARISHGEASYEKSDVSSWCCSHRPHCLLKPRSMGLG